MSGYKAKLDELIKSAKTTVTTYGPKFFDNKKHSCSYDAFNENVVVRGVWADGKLAVSIDSGHSVRSATRGIDNLPVEELLSLADALEQTRIEHLLNEPDGPFDNRY